MRQGDIDEDEQEQLAISGVSVKTARRLAATDRGAGFGGTLLTGGHGAGSKPTSGSAASMLGSEPPEQSGQSAGATRGGRSLMAIAADLEAGADVTAAEMNAISRSLGSNDLVKDKSLACERCSEFLIVGLAVRKPELIRFLGPSLAFVNGTSSAGSPQPG